MRRASSGGLDRFRKTHAAIRDRTTAVDPAVPTHVPDAIVQAIGPEKAMALANGAPNARALQAMRNREGVERLSRAGLPVAQIAAELGLSSGHVVVLRAELGLGRKR